MHYIPLRITEYLTAEEYDRLSREVVARTLAGDVTLIERILHKALSEAAPRYHEVRQQERSVMNLYSVSFKRRGKGTLKNVEVVAADPADASRKARDHLVKKGVTVGPQGWREYGISLMKKDVDE